MSSVGPFKIGKVHQADCIEAMRQMPEACVTAIVCDPPYGLEFMGKEWDKLEKVPEPEKREKKEPGHASSFPGWHGSGSKAKSSYGQYLWHLEWAKEALRIAKPGAPILAFGGTRTHHRLMCALEDAGWEIRDCLMWVYGSGFPKSLDISKAIDKAKGEEREKIPEGNPVKRMIPGADQNRTGSWIKDSGREFP
jgi:site-specific DNA-methyltransferase (adenine-specific)